jgi:hypothetical protein
MATFFLQLTRMQNITGRTALFITFNYIYPEK